MDNTDKIVKTGEPQQEGEQAALQQIEENITLIKEKISAVSEPLPQIKENIDFITERMVAFSGPLPPPDLLSKYNEIIPNAAERIFKMAENEQSSRISMERKSNINSIIMGYLGIIFAFLSVILICGLVYFSLLKGFSATASAISVGAIASVASVFIFFRRKNKKSE